MRWLFSFSCQAWQRCILLSCRCDWLESFCRIFLSWLQSLLAMHAYSFVCSAFDDFPQSGGLRAPKLPLAWEYSNKYGSLKKASGCSCLFKSIICRAWLMVWINYLLDVCFWLGSKCDHSWVMSDRRSWSSWDISKNLNQVDAFIAVFARVVIDFFLFLSRWTLSLWLCTQHCSRGLCDGDSRMDHAIRAAAWRMGYYFRASWLFCPTQQSACHSGWLSSRSENPSKVSSVGTVEFGSRGMGSSSRSSWA